MKMFLIPKSSITEFTLFSSIQSWDDGRRCCCCWCTLLTREELSLTWSKTLSSLRLHSEQTPRWGCVGATGSAAQAELALDGRDQLDGPLVPQLASSDEVTDDEYKSFVVQQQWGSDDLLFSSFLNTNLNELNRMKSRSRDWTWVI